MAVRKSGKRKSTRTEKSVSLDQVEEALVAWKSHDLIQHRLIAAIPLRGFLAQAPGTRGRNIARQLVHLHHVRVGWMRLNGFPVEGLRRFPSQAVPTRRELLAAFRASGKAVGEYLERRFHTGTRVRFFGGSPMRWLAYMISHESHHRGQIALTLKLNGMRLPEKVALRDLWYTWYRAG